MCRLDRSMRLIIAAVLSIGMVVEYFFLVDAIHLVRNLTAYPL